MRHGDCIQAAQQRSIRGVHSLIVGYKGSSTDTNFQRLGSFVARREKSCCDVTSQALWRFDWLPVTTGESTTRRTLRNGRARAPRLARALLSSQREVRVAPAPPAEVGTLLCNTPLSSSPLRWYLGSPAIDIDSARLADATAPAR